MKNIFIIVLCLYFGGIAAVVIANNAGLIGYWNFDEISGWGVKDRSGDNINGILGRALSGVTGYKDYGVLLDGVGDYINMGSAESLNFDANDSFTLAAWVKINNSIGNYRVIVGKASDSSTNGYMIRYETDGRLGMNIEASDDVAQSNAVAQNDYRDDQWHHVVGVVNRDEMTNTIYIDGCQKNQVDASLVGDLTNNHHFNIGSLGNGAVSFNGKIDEVRIYNRALTSVEVGQLYGQDYSCSEIITQIYPAGSLLQAHNSYQVYYINSQGEKDWIINEDVFEMYNNKWEDIIKVNSQVLEQYPTQVK